jgi:hypothetical protein
MKKSLIIIAAIVMIAGFTSRVMAQSTVSNTAKAELKIPISITAPTIMDFGVLAASATPGTAILTTGSSLSKTGGVTIVSGTPTAGGYSVTGEGTTAYNITIPVAATTISDGSGHSMTVTAMNCSYVGLTSNLVSGADAFTVGGTLNVGANQVAGTYTGTFDVSVNY